MGMGLSIYPVDAAMAQRVRVFGTEEEDGDEELDELIKALEGDIDLDTGMWHSSQRTDKAWDVIHWMLTGRTSDAGLFGARQTESLADESVSELEPAEVVQLARELEQVGEATMRARIPSTPDSVYLSGYRTETGTFDALVEDARALVDLVQRAAAGGRWLLLLAG